LSDIPQTENRFGKFGLLTIKLSKQYSSINFADFTKLFLICQEIFSAKTSQHYFLSGNFSSAETPPKPQFSSFLWD